MTVDTLVVAVLERSWRRGWRSEVKRRHATGT